MAKPKELFSESYAQLPPVFESKCTKVRLTLGFFDEIPALLIQP
jgi:hypothetical protein